MDPRNYGALRLSPLSLLNTTRSRDEGLQHHKRVIRECFNTLSSHVFAIRFGKVDSSNRRRWILYLDPQAMASKVQKSILGSCDPCDSWGRFFRWRLLVSPLWIANSELLDSSRKCAQYDGLYISDGERRRERGVQWKCLSSGSLAGYERHTRTERYHPCRQ
jgi:hypothetical protein